MNNKAPLTKDQLGWIIIRTMGILCLFYTIVSIYKSIVIYVQAKKYNAGIESSISYILVEGLLLLALSFYLIQEGSSLHQLITKERPD